MRFSVCLLRGDGVTPAALTLLFHHIQRHTHIHTLQKECVCICVLLHALCNSIHFKYSTKPQPQLQVQLSPWQHSTAAAVTHTHTLSSERNNETRCTCTWMCITHTAHTRSCLGGWEKDYIVIPEWMRVWMQHDYYYWNTHTLILCVWSLTAVSPHLHLNDLPHCCMYWQRECGATLLWHSALHLFYHTNNTFI